MFLFGKKELYSQFESNDKEELIKILKENLKKESRLDIDINTDQKEKLYTKLDKKIIMNKIDSIEHHKYISEMMLNDSKMILQVNFEEKSFTLKEILKFSKGEINLSLKDVQILLDEYALIISKEKIRYKQEMEERKCKEDSERIRKEEESKEFNSFFD